MSTHTLTPVRTEPVGLDDRGFVVWICTVCPGTFLGTEDHDEKLQTPTPARSGKPSGRTEEDVAAAPRPLGWLFNKGVRANG